MKKAILLTLVLSSCSVIRPPEMPVVDGIPIEYVVEQLPAPLAGQAVFLINRCRVSIDPDFFSQNPGSIAHVLAHEYGHCADFFKLNFSSNGFKNEGCKYGQYYCVPREGYAEAFAQEYTKTCGVNTDVFQFPLLQNTFNSCKLPDPYSVRP